MFVLSFFRDERGAVSIDWVALAAGLLILGVGGLSLLSDEVQTVMSTSEAEYVNATNFSVPVDN